jgi:hypothetical protein
MDCGLVVALMLLLAGQTDETRTVLDDFLTLPGPFLPETLRDPAVRAGSIVSRDLAKGFLKVQVDDTRYSVALFSTRRGSHLLAMSGSSKACEPFLRLFALHRDGTWRNVTSQVVDSSNIDTLKMAVSNQHQQGDHPDTANCPAGCSVVYELELSRDRGIIVIKVKDAGHANESGEPATVAEMRWNRSLSVFELHPMRGIIKEREKSEQEGDVQNDGI